MPIQPTYPGVYVEEIPSGVRTITGVATSVTAFVGRAARGPVDAPITCFGWEDFRRKFGGLWSQSELGHDVALFFQNGGSQAVVSRVAPNASAASVTLAGGDGLTLSAANPGRWGRDLRVSLVHADGEAFHLRVDEIDPTRLAQGYERALLASEEFFSVTLAAGPRYLPTILDQESRLVRTGTPAGPARPSAISRAPLTGGSDGDEGVRADYQAAIDALDHADIVNLVCVHPPSAIAADVLSDAASWAAANRAILLVDPPAAWDLDAAIALADLTGLRSANTAFFYPAIEASDELQGGRVRRVPVSGAVAGVAARTDATRGVWKAPAGNDAGLVGVRGLSEDLTDAETGRLNTVGVNSLRSFPLTGPVIWGARTGVGADELASEWKYLPVRRLALYIEESLRRGTKWAVFEANAEPLWGQLRLAIGSFMQQLHRQGAFAGASAREAYLVRCDASTTTPADVNLGVVNVTVGFAPLRPAEFVFLKFQQMAGQ